MNPMIEGILITPEVNQILITPPMMAKGRFNMMIPDKGKLRNS
jgi:hypothetical protein